ncbi:MAG: outer membrane protein assembly factor BamD [Pseudomonadota bacterium]
MVIVLFSGACGHGPKRADELSPPSPEKIYRKAMSLYKRNNYIDAYDAFQKCRTRYPISEWGIKSELKIADCLYYQKQYENAFNQYQEFTRLHPTREVIDYAYYQTGMCYYKQICSIDRDQTFSSEAVKHFERLLSLFPSSPYAPSAREKIKECKQKLAEHTMYIGNFYYRTGAYEAALTRYEEALNNYYDALSSPELLMFHMGRLYLRLDKPEEAREQFIALIRDYPESQYAPLCETLLEDPKKIEDLDEVKILPLLKKLNPLGAIKSVPIPFLKKKRGEEKVEETEEGLNSESHFIIPAMTS